MRGYSMKGKRRWACAALCALLLPARALGVTEGVVEKAPEVSVGDWTMQAQEGYLPEPDSAFASRVAPAWEQDEENGTVLAESIRGMTREDYDAMTCVRRLTRGEAVRAEALLARYEAGEATGDGESVLGARKGVIVGVYAVDPAQYDGERVILALPGTMLTDEQLLSIIDAYHRLGLRFDPHAVSERNCVRGHAFGRNLTREELERKQILSRQIQTGVLDPSGCDAGALLHAKIDWRGYLGAFGDGEMLVCPYRRMTDEELAAYLVLCGVKDESEGLDGVMLEREARAQLAARMGCSLSMELTAFKKAGRYRTRETEGLRKLVELRFSDSAPDGRERTVYAKLDAETGEALWLEAFEQGQEEAQKAAADEAAYAAAASAYAKGELGLDGLTFDVAKRSSGGHAQMEAIAQLPDRQVLTIRMSLEGRIEQVGMGSVLLLTN